MVTTISSEEFEQTRKEGKNLFVFGANWCPDCVRINPFLDTLSEEFAERVKIFKVSIDSAQNLKESLGIRKIPTLIFYNNGTEIGERLIEPNNRDSIANALKALADA